MGTICSDISFQLHTSMLISDLSKRNTITLPPPESNNNIMKAPKKSHRYMCTCTLSVTPSQSFCLRDAIRHALV